ncbi:MULTISPECIES: helix-turn-helix transcriptional regulator [unclassified Streptomyces]|uniref:helix-turn-helix transcriptional regulator n=1 Tax=unclassified Streptomyces TaxID=2593676 RepID=UPI00081E83BE|nr:MULTISPECIES: helix-turn-helix transcriptional regulator [unclassified Streptomyces]MYR94863.1 helix-turn-helix transcriptional regulator [Streptomyces sp. SID4937]SCD79460.1 regulatory protein, luxR family [Streptomyces sp. ScaeMP-e83]
MGTEEGRTDHRPHGSTELCDAALRLYERALRAGRVARPDLTAAPCLIELGLLHPDPWDDAWMHPVPPSAALANLLQPVSREIDERLRLATALSRTLFPLTAVAHDDPNLAITVLEGVPAIQASLNEATATATDEILTAQPGSDRPASTLREALANAHTAIRRGARIRHIYQHPARYSSAVRDYLAQVPAQHLQVRTTELTVERLIIVDRTVAYIPASADRNTALRISHPALVSYLIQVYEVLWAQAVPLAENHQATAPGAPVTAVQHSIARLLAEGHVDDVVARKMGISVRTCRSHIAKLMQSLGATSRTHLGTLLVESGIVEATGAEQTSRPAPTRPANGN